MYSKRYQTSVLEHDDASEKKKPFPWRRIAIIAGCIVFIVGIFFFIRAPKFQITTVTVAGTHVADPLDVSQFVLGSMQGNYLYILPKTSVLLVSTDHIAALIQSHFPRFKTVEVDRSGMASLNVAVEEYPGVYLWCDEAERCSFMDETGTVFADAPYFSGSAYQKIYIGERAPYPFVPVLPEQIAMIEKITGRLEAIDIEAVSFVFENERKLSIAFNHHASVAYIFFDPTRDIEAALESLYSGLRTPEMSKRYYSSASELEYFDLRFSNKLIYKFR